jgi:Protein of unknown function (DUF2845)
MTCSRVFAAGLMLACAASAQDTVEHAAATANATSTTGMRSAGKGAASVMEKAAKTLNGAAAPSPSAATTIVVPGATQKREPAARIAAPDPSLISPGMPQEELILRFGQPAMKTSGTEDSATVETWWYGSGPDAVTVKLADGKVRTVSPPARPAPSPRKPDTQVTVLP